MTPELPNDFLIGPSTKQPVTSDNLVKLLATPLD